MIAEQIGEDLNCVVLPIGQLGLLVPSACVAEVLPWRRIYVVKNGPEWLLGVMTWRGDSIPVVRFDKLNGSDEERPGEGECVAVMNRCRSANGQAFYAIATYGLPHMVPVGEADVTAEQIHLGVAEVAAVKLGAERLRIPNLGYVEDQLTASR